MVICQGNSLSMIYVQGFILLFWVHSQTSLVSFWSVFLMAVILSLLLICIAITLSQLFSIIDDLCMSSFHNIQLSLSINCYWDNQRIVEPDPDIVGIVFSFHDFSFSFPKAVEVSTILHFISSAVSGTIHSRKFQWLYHLS